MFDNLDDPKTQLLMMMGLGLLGGAPGKNKNFGADLAHGGLLGLQGYGQAKTMQSRLAEQKQAQEMRDMQMAQMKRQQAEQEQIRGLGARAFAPNQNLVANDDMGNPMPSSGGGGMPEFAQGLMGINPMLGAQFMPKPQGPIKMGKDDRLVDPVTRRELIAAAPGEQWEDLGRDPRTGQHMQRNKVTGQLKAAGTMPTQFTVNNREESEFAKKMGGNYAEQYDALLKGGMAAGNKLRDLTRFQNIVSKVPTGKLEPLKAEVGRLAASLGVNVDTKTLGYQDALEAMSNQFALTLRNPNSGAGMPGALSDKDREFLVSMVPGLGKTPGGNMLIIEAFRRVAQREADVAKLAREYKGRTGKFDDGFYAVLEQRFAGQDLLGDLYEKASASGAATIPAQSDPLGIRG